MERPEDYINEPPPAEDMLYSDEMSITDNGGNVRWLDIARNAYESSTDYFDANIRKQVEKNLNLFQSKHPSGSKYSMDAYKHRSKIFRPKTRATVRKHEAAASLAFFSSPDAVACTAENQDSPEDVMGAEYAKNLIDYRLEHSIPWFSTLVGAYQDALTQGVVISRQDWVYTTKEVIEDLPVFGQDGLVEVDEAGEVMTMPVPSIVPDDDRPEITLIPIENFRFDPACDWRDPAGTSPYLIELIPMYVYQVKERMEEDNEKTGETSWFQLSDGEITSALQTGDDDSTRHTREGDREDSKDIKHATSLYDIVWVHRNIAAVDGEDWIFYSLGTEFMLSDPVPVTEVYQHGRPYVVGMSEIETHKPYPSAPVQLGEDLQIEANDITNQRLDNIKLALNRRYLAKRGQNTDWRALTTSTPGGVILVDDLNDVKEERVSDVTSSSYEEQNRINVDYDELMGNFSQSTVSTNSALNKTLGGQQIAADDTNIITEFQLRIFTETWVEPVIRQLHALEVNYETDDRILKLAGEKALKSLGTKNVVDDQQQAVPTAGDIQDAGKVNENQAAQEVPQFKQVATHESQVPVDPETVSQLIARPMGVKVTVGFGSTSPQKRIERLTTGLSTIIKLFPMMAAKANLEQINKEVFGALGYGGGSSFFKLDNVDPQVAQLQQQVKKLQAAVKSKQMDNQAKLQVAQVNNQTKMQIEAARQQHDQALAGTRSQLEYIQKQLTAETNDIKRGELMLQENALKWQQQTEELSMLTAERDKMIKAQTEQMAQPIKTSGAPAAIGGQSEGDGLVDDMGSTVIANDNYQDIPMAEG